MRMPITLTLVLAAAALLPGALSAAVLEGDCQLILEAIDRANAGEQVYLVLDPGAIYLLDRAPLGKRGLPLLRGSLSIDGQGASIRGYPGIAEAIFHVAPGASLSLRSLTIAEGAAGALLNHGSVDLLDVTLEDNTVVRGHAVMVNHGFGRFQSSDLRHNLVYAGHREGATVLNFGILELADSAFLDNAIDRSEPTVVVAGSVLNRGRLYLDDVVVLGNRPLDDPERRGYGEIVDLGTGVSEGNPSSTSLVRSGKDLAQPAPSRGEWVQSGLVP
jgi:hypothetical protein